MRVKIVITNTEEKGGQKMQLQAKEVGNIQITVYKTEDGYPFFYIKPNDESLLPIVDILEDTLKLY